ncbi:hypothetical protein GPECTOR_2g1371 [Gonium pectorale]|uniref:Sodium/calcium exchanger membrane region domain-containing protein n=1 Tax=Gonium pectorale TaxID=33097 RepID=A0A150H2K2_GONPE|nr:hypothetical protein GPECTOR_2g1371 [Gonium pectorale]|eukprot:KXZ55820.1 hypothetical protein GPECTOR_2g1371 [Gonium pectorale]
MGFHRPGTWRHMACALLLSVAVSAHCAAAQDSPEPQPPPAPAPAPAYTCDRLDRVPPAERCPFVLAECESDSRLPYTVWYHCHVAPRGVFVSALFTLALVCLLPLLFTLLGDTAEIYFSPIMTHISQSIPKMRPRFAGVTFVAIGNGAPDLSSNISAIRNGDVLLSAGALTGAAMFVQCVVASEVMRASRGPVKCRGATLRDVAIYSASVLLVLAAFWHGRIGNWFIACAALLYLTYAVWVFVGDEWHERGRPAATTVWAGFRSAVEGRFGSRRGGDEGLLPWAQVDLSPGLGGGQGGTGGADELTAPLVPVADMEARSGPAGISSRPTSPEGRQPAPRQAHHHHLVSAKAYQSMVWADLNPEDRRLPTTAEADGEGDAAAGRRRRGRRQRSGGTHGGRGGGGGGGAAGSSLELGQTGYVAPRAPPAPEASNLAANASGGGSQLFTLSSQDGSVLPAPAPVDAVPAGPTGGPSASGAAQAGVAGAAGRSGSAGGVARLADPWVGEGSQDGYATSEEEDAGLLEAYRRVGGKGGAGGAGGGGGSDADEVSVASSRRQAAPLGLWERVRHELTVGAAAEWDELPPDNLRARWRALSFPLLLPIYAALRFTIPFVDPATYSRRWLLATCVGAPLLAATYVAPGSLVALLVAGAAGAALAAAVGYFTAGEEDALPDWDCGSGFAFGPAGFAVFGFFMGVLWIDTLASEAVGIISLLAGVLRVPASVMGLTLMAWGNSLGDFFGNPAMARRGAPTMALTACFAGPLFNMLASLALGFGSYFARRRVGHADVQLRPEVALGCVFLVTYNAVVAATGLANGGRLPERFYLFARAYYATYFAAACFLGLWAGQSA